MKSINDLINTGKVFKMNKLKIRGFIGVIGSGKDFQAKRLIKNQGYIRVDFADTLRDCAWKILNWTPKDNNQYEKFKSKKVFISGFGHVDGRKFLQELGQAMRNVDENFWVNMWNQRVDKMQKMGYDKIVVTDVRYQNELDIIKNIENSDAKVYFCNYKSERYDANSEHGSEKFAQSFLNTHNDGDEI